MQQENNKYNLILFMMIAMTILIAWNYFYPPNNQTQESYQKIDKSINNTLIDKKIINNKQNLIFAYTDNYKVSIDSISGDIKNLKLNKYNDVEDENTEFTLFEDNKDNKFYLQTGLLNSNNNYVSNDIPFKTTNKKYYLNDNDDLNVILTKPIINGVEIKKTYTFYKNKYLIDVTYEIKNHTNSDLELKAMYRMLRDDKDPKGSNFFAHTYAGAVVYNPQNKFEKVSFEDINKGKAKYPQKTQTGWLGYIQHYFSAIWLLQPKNENSICEEDNKQCYIDISKRASDGLYSIGFTKFLDPIKSKSSIKFTTRLYAGPQEYNSLINAADQLQLVKDYGKVHVFSSPLFWLLQKINSYIKNWGWSIILLVILIKLILFPLNHTSFKSMAKMTNIAPKLKEIKDTYGNDKIKMQQEMMSLYKKEKINPLGGCLPMIVQIPIFIGLYWALFNSVELRQAPWIGWIKDLSRTDPYYILPAIMALTMFLQTFLNPPPSDPVQAKMMKIMPIAFSVMFFFFPSGLVLYWVVNNILSILQQWIIKKNIETKKHQK